MLTSRKFIILAIFAVSLLFQACTRIETSEKIGSHKVNIDRKSGSVWIHKPQFDIQQENGIATGFTYRDAVGSGFGGINVALKGDDLFFGGKLLGKLNKDDEIHIGNDGTGVTINNLDHGETEKYLSQTLVAKN